MRTISRAAVLVPAVLLPAALLVLGGPRLVLAEAPVAQGEAQGSAARGAALFSGSTAFARGGPPCGSCHSVAGLEFPNGGTLGPDLTTVYDMFGPQGVAVTLQTLYFPTMTPIFDGRLLTPAEQGDLAAFLKEAGTQTPPGGVTGLLALIALGGLLLLLAATWVGGRGRLHGVRRPLVRARARPGATPP